MLFPFLFHRRQAESHETRFARLNDQRARLRSDVADSKESTITAIKVLTDEVARHEKLEVQLS